jgi:hypothetical protein
MSFKSEYTTINICVPQVREALSNVIERHGWSLVENKEGITNPVKVRAHENNTEVFPIVLVNPDEASRAYDIGLRVTDDESVDVVYDRYLNSVTDEWGEEANGLLKETVLESIRLRHNSTVQAEDFAEFLDRYAVTYNVDSEGNRIEESVECASMEALKNYELEVEFNSLDCPQAAVEC